MGGKLRGGMTIKEARKMARAKSRTALMADRDKLLQALKIAKLNRGLKDHFYFVKEILSNPDLTERTHGELCAFLDSQNRKKKLILLPRGSFKTTIITIGYALRRIVKDRNIRILINSDVYDSALKYLKKIKEHFETEGNLRWLYGDFVGKTWKETEITVLGRTKIHKEPTVMCGSIDIQRVGMHYDLIINDDLVNKENTATKEQIRKTIDFFKGQTSIIEPGGEIIVVGTRWNFDDLYGHIQSELKNDFDIYIKKAIQEDGTLFFPERLSQKFLNETRSVQGSYMFSNQYQNEPINPEDQIFKNVLLFDSGEEPAQKFYRSMTIDPAISLKETADFTGITICDTFEDGRIFVQEALELKLSVDEIINTIFDLNFRFKPDIIAIETIGFQRVLKYFIEKRQSDEKIFLPLEELKSSNRVSKHMRITALQPFFERKQMLIKADLNNLYEQLKMYPKTTHDDLADSLSMHLEIVRAPFVMASPDMEKDYRGKARPVVKKTSEPMLTDEHGLID